MNRKYITRFVLYFQIIICTASLYSQNNINYYNSRAFGYNIYGSVAPLGPFKMFLNSPVITNLSPDPLADNYIAGASFASDGKLYGIRYGSNMLVKIDTTTGVITNIGYSGPGTGMAFDWVSNTMYMITCYASSSLLNKVNLSNGILTSIGQSYNGYIADIAVSNNGKLYGVDISADKLIRINKLNGEITGVGSLGFDANNSQGMSWDHSTDSCYYASYNNLTNQCEMRKINLINGSSVLLFSIPAQIDGFAIPGAGIPVITHKQYNGSENVNGPYTINCYILNCGSLIDPSKVKVMWSRNNPMITDSTSITQINDTLWTANIPGNGTAAMYRYYIKAVNGTGVGVSPPGAPFVLYTFFAGPDLIKPVIYHLPISNCPKQSWPATVFASAADNFGIDSVWVSWHKNNSSILKQFKLNHTFDSVYFNEFNSIEPEVEIGDSITYHIIAQDNSSNHNRDSTQNYTFKIIGNPVCMGPGSYDLEYPFCNSKFNNRTQLLFLASEITENWGSAGYITKIGFNFISSMGILENFNIRFKHTDNEVIAGFDNSGWTTAYSGTYVTQGSGWRYILLQTPFYWNGISNLMLEFCNHNRITYITENKVYSSLINLRTVFSSNDTLPGCNLYYAISSQIRPNMCLQISLLTGENKTSETVKNYLLEQNYPNPFNPCTRIKYSIPKTSPVRLTVYDMLGRVVKVLVNEIKKQGSYSAAFEGMNLATGIYFYALYAGEFYEVKKMLLLK